LKRFTPAESCVYGGTQGSGGLLAERLGEAEDAGARGLTTGGERAWDRRPRLTPEATTPARIASVVTTAPSPESA
jgi:hypothetical protein